MHERILVPYDGSALSARALDRVVTKPPDDEGRTVHEVGNPHRVIVEYVDDHDVDHVVMGSHGRTGVSRLLLGSTAEQVMRQSPVPVTVVR